jgi:hypothetical protein
MTYEHVPLGKEPRTPLRLSVDGVSQEKIPMSRTLLSSVGDGQDMPTSLRSHYMHRCMDSSAEEQLHQVFVLLICGGVINADSNRLPVLCPQGVNGHPMKIQVLEPLVVNMATMEKETPSVRSR